MRLSLRAIAAASALEAPVVADVTETHLAGEEPLGVGALAKDAVENGHLKGMRQHIAALPSDEEITQFTVRGSSL